MTILVTGARGSIGSRVITRLDAAGHPVRGSARDLTTLRLPSGVEAVELDLTDPGVAGADALRGVEAVFLYPVIGSVDAFLERAAKAGVRYLVLLSSPASYEVAE